MTPKVKPMVLLGEGDILQAEDVFLICRSLWKKMKTTQTRRNSCYLFRAGYSKGVNPHQLLLAEIQGRQKGRAPGVL